MRWINIFLILFISVPLYAEELEYVPEGKFDMDSYVDSVFIQEYSHYLSIMQEPSLWEISKKSRNEVYRFFLYRTPRNQVCVRVEIKQSGDALVYIKILQFKKVGYIITQESTLTDEVKSISKNEVLTLIIELDKTKFWEIKLSDYPAGKILDDGSMVAVADGSNWIFEGIKSGIYQAFNVPNPTHPLFKVDAIVDLGKIFFSLAELEVEDLE